MPLVILKSSYIKSMTHFENLITYCDSKVEAQMLADGNGKLQPLNIDEIAKLDSDKVLKIQLENGKTVTTSAEKFAAKYAIKNTERRVQTQVYSKDAREGKFSGKEDLKRRTKRIKSLFTNEIFKDDLEHIKVNKNEMQTQIQQALRQKCIDIAQKNHSVPDEFTTAFSQISDMLLDNAKGRKYYEYQNEYTKRKINEMLKIAVESDEKLRDIYLSLKSNQEKFVRAYNDSEETVKKYMSDWERRFFDPQKDDDKRLHNLIIAQSLKYNAAYQEAMQYALSQFFWNIVPAVCAYADISLDSGDISYNECEYIKKNSMDIAWQIAQSTAFDTDEEDSEKLFDKMYSKYANQLLDKRLMSDNLHIALYVPNGGDYVNMLNIEAKAELDLFFTAKKFAEKTYEELGEKAFGCVIFVHNASDSGAQFEIQQGGKIRRIYNGGFAQKAAASGVLPKRFDSFDEQKKPPSEKKLSRVHCLAVWKNYKESAQVRVLLRQALTVSQKRQIKQIAQSKAFDELGEKEQKEVCKIVESAILSDFSARAEFDKFVDSLYLTYREKFDESTAEKYREYTKKALLAPKANEISPLQNTAIFASRYIKTESPKKAQYHTKMLMFQLAQGMSQMASQADRQENIADNTKKKSPLTKAQNRHIALENGEEYDEYGY